jgi:hypothetical protein
MQSTDWNDVRQRWSRPSEVAGAGPREVRLSAGGTAIAFLALLMFAGAIATVIGLSRVSARETAERAQLDASSVEAQATITRHWRTDDKSDTPMIAYEFEYGGHKLHGTSSAPGKEWRALAIGDTIPIRVVPENPEWNHPSAWQMRVMPQWLPFLTGGLLAVIGLLLMALLQREKRLLSDGQAAPALVVGLRRVKGGQSLKYEFRLNNGEVMKGRGGQMRNPPELGSVVTIIYDVENPKRNAPYPLDLVRVDR